MSRKKKLDLMLTVFDRELYRTWTILPTVLDPGDFRPKTRYTVLLRFLLGKQIYYTRYSFS